MTTDSKAPPAMAATTVAGSEVQVGPSVTTSTSCTSQQLPPSGALEYAESPSTADTIPAQDRSHLRLTAIMTALFLSLFVAALDVTIVATAIPVISHDLNSASGYTWVGGAYTLANAVAAPIWAKLSDIWGRKLIMLSAIALFFVSSTVCATADTMKALIIGRSFQGVAGGGLILLVHIAISDLFSMRTRSLFMGLTEGIWAVAGGVGPVLGGTFASLVSWRWCFYVNLPICGIAFALLFFFLDIKHEHTSFKDGAKAIDWFGIAAFLAFTLMVLLGLDFGGIVFPWDSAKVIALLVVGTCMISVFIYSEARLAKYPLIPLHVFKDKSNVAALLVGFSHGMTFISAEYYIPLYYQAVKQETPIQSGVLLIPLVMGTAFVGILAGIIQHRTGGRYRELIWFGTSFICLGVGLFIMLKADTSIAEAIGLQLIFGAGSGCLFSPPLIAIQNHSKQTDVATATSTFSFCRSMAISISIIIGGVVFQNSMDVQQRTVLSEPSLGLSADVLSRLTGKEAAANVIIPSTLSDPRQSQAVKEAFAWSMRNMWIMYTGFAGIGVISGWFIKHGTLNKDHQETITGIKKTVRDVVNP